MKKRHCRDPKCVAAPNGLRHVYSYGVLGGGSGAGAGLQIIRPPEYAHVAHSLPPWDPAAPRHDETGQPVFYNRREIQEYQSKRPGSVWQ